MKATKIPCTKSTVKYSVTADFLLDKLKTLKQTWLNFFFNLKVFSIYQGHLILIYINMLLAQALKKTHTYTLSFPVVLPQVSPPSDTGSRRPGAETGSKRWTTESSSASPLTSRSVITPSPFLAASTAQEQSCVGPAIWQTRPKGSPIWGAWAATTCTTTWRSLASSQRRMLQQWREVGVRSVTYGAANQRFGGCGLWVRAECPGRWCRRRWRSRRMRHAWTRQWRCWSRFIRARTRTSPGRRGDQTKGCCLSMWVAYGGEVFVMIHVSVVSTLCV